MADGTVFPAFLQLRYEDDGSARSQFLRAVDDTILPAEKRFEQFSATAKRMVDQVLTTNRTAGGNLDLGVPELQRQAVAMQQKAMAARELATATELAAREAGDFSQTARLEVAAMQATAREAEQAAASARDYAIAQAQIQAQLNRTVSSVTAVTGATRGHVIANDNATKSANLTRMGMQQLGLQLNDVATMWSLGARGSQIFASQSGQVIQAVQLMTGGTSGLARFLAGPWGIALSTAAIALTPFIGKLFEADDAAKQVEFTTSRLGDAQSALANVMDVATGRINVQSDALMGLARAQALAGQISARQDMAAARKSLTGEAAIRPHITAGFGGGLSITRGRDATGDIASAVLDGSLGTTSAIAGLESLRKTGYATEDQMLRVAQSVVQLGVAGENLKAFEAAQRMLQGQGTAADRSLLLQPHKPAKPHDNTKELQALAEFGEDAGKKIASIGDRFADIPPEVLKVNSATRELDDIISDLQRRKPEGFQAMVDQAERLKDVLPDLGMAQAMSDLREQSQQQLEVERLITQGRDKEAAALQVIWQLKKQFGPQAETEAGAIRDIVQARELELEALRRIQEQQSAYLDATRSIRSELEAILAGEGNLKNFQQTFRQLQGRVLTEQIFGPALRELDQWVKGGGKLEQQVDFYAEQTNRAGQAALDLADTFNNASRRIATGGAANDNGSWGAFLNQFDSAFGDSGSLKEALNLTKNGDPNEIVVTAARRLDQSAVGLSPDIFFNRLSHSIAGPLTEQLNNVFGTQFFSQFETAIGGALYGYSTAGGVGAGIGGLQGLIQQFGGDVLGKGLTIGLGDGLGKALKGAQAGSLVAGLGNALGFKTSGTGAELGGALGSFIPIPGGQVIGAIAGSIIEKVFAGTAKGSATLTGASGISGTTGSGDNLKSALGLAGSVQEGLAKIADALDAQIGSFAVSIGMRDNDYRVDPYGHGQTSTKDPGVRDFGQDQQAAIAYAIQNAIQDGAIQGINAATMRLLQSGKDLDAALQDALDFQGILKKIGASKDPVTAALDDLDAQFERYKDLFNRAGATTEQWNDLEAEYWTERDQTIKQATEKSLSSLKGLMDELTIGNDALSLRDRESAALAKYNPLAARVAAGDSSASDDFAEAARALLDIERQMNGSQSGYFDILDQVKSLTQGALGGGAGTYANRDSPFGPRPLADDNVGVVNAINQLGNQLVQQLGDKIVDAVHSQGDAASENLGMLIAQGERPTSLGYWHGPAKVEAGW